MSFHLRTIAACLGALALATPVRADDTFWGNTFEVIPPSVPNPYRYAWSDPRLPSRIGVGVTMGGGVAGFTDQDLRDLLENNVSVGWNLRLSLGTHIPLGIELVYMGSAATLETLTEDDGFLVGTTFEAVVRYTILPLADGTPYVFAGGGWQRYDVRDTRPMLADEGLRESDVVAEFPMGAGAAYRDPSGWVGDVRGTFRLTTDSVLLRQPNGDNAKLSSWEATAAIGYEF